MCISTPKTPDVPTIPERQPTKLPDNGATAGVVDQNARRRRGLYASVFTNPQGLGAPSTTSTSVLG
ncbi:hypothetical protein [Sphingomonas asaccharolytica]|uniref:hypothetical protein n=1 Tax=Sphingomonas asaccharolytica TaxID=40681 RepID=UPI000A0446D5|nr:hypothetical protein [Sphingomonas asaccharolytica]